MKNTRNKSYWGVGHQETFRDLVSARLTHYLYLRSLRVVGTGELNHCS